MRHVWEQYFVESLSGMNVTPQPGQTRVRSAFTAALRQSFEQYLTVR
jgi:hypothetical protein